MLELAERAWFRVCLTMGRLLRSARYSKARIVCHHGERKVLKSRLFHAPLLVWIGAPLLSILNTGVRVLRQRDWEERERRIYLGLHGASIGVEVDGTLVLPCLPGQTLASVLEDPGLEESLRKKAIEHAVKALAAFHRAGFTHGDAMAENVLVDLDRAAAHWIDFETLHDPRRSLTWRRADDVRAFLATCLLRTDREKRAETLRLVLNAYADQETARVLTTSFTSVWRRPLTLHLGQAALSFECFREIGRLLRERPDD